MSERDFYDRQPARRRPMNWPATWHRIRAVREREDVSLGSLARRTKINVNTLKELEESASDPPISLLCRVASGLRVPVSDLLVDHEAELSEPIRQRACLVRIARTAHTLLEKAKNKSLRCLSETLVIQLKELMPEVDQLGTWPEVGKRRLPTDVPRLLERMVIDVPGPIRDDLPIWDDIAGLDG